MRAAPTGPAQHLAWTAHVTTRRDYPLGVALAEGLPHRHLRWHPSLPQLLRRTCPPSPCRADSCRPMVPRWGTAIAIERPSRTHIRSPDASEDSLKNQGRTDKGGAQVTHAADDVSASRHPCIAVRIPLQTVHSCSRTPAQVNGSRIPPIPYCVTLQTMKCYLRRRA